MRDAYFGPGAHPWGGSAASVYEATTHRHAPSAPAPFGMLCWWLGGTEDDGHVDASLGDGTVLTTDWAPDGYVGDGRIRRVNLETIARYSNPARPLRYVGWTEDIDGSVVPVALTTEDKTWLAALMRETLAALGWGMNAGEPSKLAIPDDGSWKTAVAGNNLHAIIAKLGTSGATLTDADIDAIAERVRAKLAGALAS